ncbi:MAG: TonB-dependent receptor [Pseudomonadota bacterium]|nr:TonB-dependent receptor [Pseudomonadota bacterium]
MKCIYRARLLASTLMVGSCIAAATPALAQAPGQTDQTSANVPPASEAAGVQAQATMAPEAAGRDIVVTGSLIKNPNIESVSPVQVITSDEVELRQANVAEQFLRELPGVVPSIGSAVNNGNGGASFVNLRGLGSNRNLVLLNGTRLVPAELQGRVDLNNIPLALVERTDVLTGGASSTYGADAVAGVINFITKDNFAGVDLSATDQITGKGDGHYYRADLTIGANFDDGRGNAVLSFGYQHSDPIYQGARPYGAFNIDSYSGAAGGSGTTVPGRFSVTGVGTRQINTDTGALVPTFQTFNFNPYNIYQTPFERFNIFGAAHYDVTPDITVYSEALFSKNKVSTIIAPSGTFGNALTIPISNPYIPAAARDTFCLNSVDADPVLAGKQAPTAAQCGSYYGATNPNDPNYRTFTTAAFRRFVESGPRLSEYTTQLFQIKGGVRGNITSNFNYDVFGTYGESENIQRQTGNGLLSRLQQASLATSKTACLNTSNNCVPINLFGPQGSITADQLGFLVGVSTSGSTQTTLGTVHGVVSGDFGVASPFATSPISIAVGGEYRKYTAGTTSDLATQTPGEVLGNGGASPDTRGGYNVKEAFGELIVPLVEDRPLFRSLTLQLGARYSDYSTTGGSWTYKAGATWEPVSSIKFRGEYARAVRSPNINELFSPLVTGLDNLNTDPCAGAAPTANANLRAVCLAQGAPVATIGSIQNPSAGQPNVTSGGNPNLDVEKANTFTAGVVLQPDFFRGFSATVDYYNISVTNAITFPTVGDVVGACFNNISAASAASVACTQIRRNPLTGGLDGSSATTPGLPQPYSNLGRILTDGVDATINYRRDLGFSKLNLSFIGNWTSRSKFQATPTSVYRECTGFYSINCGSIQPKFSFNQRTTLSFGSVDLSLLWRYIHPVNYEPAALRDDIASGGGPVQAFQHIGAYHYFDLSTRIQATDQFSFLFAVRNLFDRKPPATGSGIGSTSYNSGNTYPSTYDAIGRLFSATARLTF